MLKDSNVDVNSKIEKRLTSRAIIVKSGKILLMHRNKSGKEYYTLIGGKLKKGESPKDAMIREVKEETSLDVLEFEKVFELEDDKRYSYYFLVQEFEGDSVLGGPELDRNSFENRYALEWVEFDKFDNINLMNMPELKEKVKKYFYL